MSCWNAFILEATICMFAIVTASAQTRGDGKGVVTDGVSGQRTLVSPPRKVVVVPPFTSPPPTPATGGAVVPPPGPITSATTWRPVTTGPGRSRVPRTQPNYSLVPYTVKDHDASDNGVSTVASSRLLDDLRATNHFATSGVTYFFELFGANGERFQHNADHLFHTRDEVVLHLVNHVDGRVWVFQRRSDGSLRTLFPDADQSATDNWVRAGKDIQVPSPGFRLEFDPRAGLLTLFVVVTPEGSHIERILAGVFEHPGSETARLEARVQEGRKDLRLVRVEGGIGTQAYRLRRQGLIEDEPLFLQICLQQVP